MSDSPHPVRLQLSFRHFTDARLDNLGPVNILIGQNNSGKTSIFRGVAETAERLRKPDPRPSHSKTSLSLGHEASLHAEDHLLREMMPNGGILVTTIGDTISVVLEYDRDGTAYSCRGDDTTDPRLKARLRRSGRQSALNSEECGSARTFSQHWLRQCFFLWHRRKSQINEVLAPGNFDSLDPEAEHLAGRLNAVLSGRGASNRAILDAFMNAVIPGIGEVHVARHTKSSKDVADVPSETTFLSVRFAAPGGQDLGFDSLGGGVEQVLAIALVLLTEPEGGALFIEEPESHLHESAQRRLVEQIEKHRGNRQIFIATHSPVFMNSFRDARIYRVTRDREGKGQIAACVDLHDQRDALDDLGLLPSTLLQTNCVVWVEGPTEVLLITYWLELVAPDLKVHQHYEFAQTGGSNLAGLGVDLDEDEQTKLIDIFKICRHNFLVADRDAPPGEDPKKEHLQALTDLLGQGSHGESWITWGHEIEWYYPPAAITARWRTTIENRGVGPFYDALARTGVKGVKTARDRKPEYAARMVRWSRDTPEPGKKWFKDPAGEHLRQNLNRLAAFIRQANDMNTTAPVPCPTCGLPRTTPASPSDLR